MKSRNILCIEDDPLVGRVLETYLLGQVRGFALAATFQDGLKELAARHYDAVVLDLLLPGAPPPVEAIQRICEAAPHTAILVLTAYAEVSAEEAVRRGAQDFLLKPVSREQLLDKLRLAIARQEVRPVFCSIEQKLDRAGLIVGELREGQKTMREMIEGKTDHPDPDPE